MQEFKDVLAYEQGMAARDALLFSQELQSPIKYDEPNIPDDMSSDDDDDADPR